jgi:hypothetical protein
MPQQAIINKICALIHRLPSIAGECCFPGIYFVARIFFGDRAAPGCGAPGESLG